MRNSVPSGGGVSAASISRLAPIEWPARRARERKSRAPGNCRSNSARRRARRRLTNRKGRPARIKASPSELNPASIKIRIWAPMSAPAKARASEAPSNCAGVQSRPAWRIQFSSRLVAGQRAKAASRRDKEADLVSSTRASGG